MLYTTLVEPPPSAIPARTTIYIVDDDEAVRDSIGLLLTLKGFHVEGFDTPKEFLLACASILPDVALIDIRMPSMGGLELQQVLRARQIQIPVILMTGYPTVAAARVAFKAGAADLLPKPVAETELFEALRSALGASV